MGHGIWRLAQSRAQPAKENDMTALKLHDLELSGNCYKVHLFFARFLD
jgi:hypothetical protein